MTFSLMPARDTFLPSARPSGREKSATFLPAAGGVFSPLTTNGAASRASDPVSASNAMRRLSIGTILLFSKHHPPMRVRPRSQSRHRLDRERHLLLVANDDDLDRRPGLDEPRRGVEVGDAVGPAAIQRQQPVAGLQPGGRRGAAR